MFKGETTEWAVVPTEDFHCAPGMQLRCVQHVHESPVRCKPLRLLYQDDLFTVLNKPVGISCTSAGQLHHNGRASTLALAQYQLGLPKLSPAHLIDKPVSFITLLAQFP